MLKAPVVPSDLLANVYEAAACADRWPSVIEQATSWVGGIAGSFQARQLTPRLESYLISSGVDPEKHQLYLSHLYQYDPHLAHVAGMPVGRPLLSTDVLSDAELQRTEFYNDFCVPQQFHDLQGVVLVRNERWAVSLAMFAHTGHRFDRTTQARLGAVGHHIQRALSMGFQIEGQASAETTLHVMARAHMVGLLYVDQSLRVVEEHESASAGEWLRAGDCAVELTGRGLRARTPADQQKLKEGVGRALSGEACSLLIGAGPSALCVAFAPGPRRSPISRERCASLVFMRAQHTMASSGGNEPFAALPESLRAVAECLADGMTDKEIAVQLGYTLATARTYVTRCLVRLGLRSRREVMALRSRRVPGPR